MTNNNLVNTNTTSLTSLSDSFILLFEADRRRIYAYIYAFVMDPDIADEIFQETSVLLWRDFEKFEPGSNFSKWANGIVFNRVRSYRRKEKKHQLCLSDEVIGELAGQISYSDNSEKRWQALQACLATLTPSLQQVYTDFYVKNSTANELAKTTGRSVSWIRKAVQKLRKKLVDCVDRKQREGQV